MTQANGFGRWVRCLWLVGCLVACKKEPAPPPVTPVPPAPPAPQIHFDAPSDLTGTTSGTTPTTPTPPTTPSGEDSKNREWTAASVKVTRQGVMPVTLRSVRAARNEGFDRVVFEFDGAQVPGYQLQYVDKPIIKCGSGDPTEVAGQAWLQVTLTPAQAHEGSQATVTEREHKPALPVLQELELTCDFEGEVTWVLGNAHPNKYRVMELHEPTRLVVDVQQ